MIEKKWKVQAVSADISNAMMCVCGVFEFCFVLQVKSSVCLYGLSFDSFDSDSSDFLDK